ncbi:Nif11-like leader peptide family natural product precursor [Laspinema olomoucense]|uniref:Nif11-like leader peptide family natural product precursor n=1 Tax=Laspinema olomoucense TaxID=3231600 RepID=UPI0021BB9286|nr:Nif11-like leader peptide family natural product precursor [Laspinema sp. D3a]MCT7989008.1 Nif11-like leader peptide family natural product precursor [Laspinema sp. D3a]
MSSTFKDLLEAAELNPQLKTQLKEAKTLDNFVKIAAEYDCDMTVEELKEAVNSVKGIKHFVIFKGLFEGNKTISKAVIDFLEIVQSNPKLKTRLKSEADSPESFASVARDHGFQLTIDEIESTFNSVEGLEKLKIRWNLRAK